MWSGGASATIPSGAVGAVYSGHAAAAQNQQRHDVFVGNLSFNTTEEQLHQVFSSEIGKVLKVRMVTDPETGRPRGFAFIEFEEPHAALSAIRNMNDYELNGRRLRVNFSNSSHLEALAGKLGMDLSQAQRPAASATTTQPGVGTQAVAEALKAMSKGEMYDVIAKLKEIADRDQDEARRILSGHPQLPEAVLFLMSKLDMVKTPVTSDMNPAMVAPGIPLQPQTVAATPSAAVAATAAIPRVADPRARAMDPRAAAAAVASPATGTTSIPAMPPAAPVLPADPRAQAAALGTARVDPRTRAGLPSVGAVPQQQQQQQQQPPPRPATLPPPPPLPPQQYNLPIPQMLQQHAMMQQPQQQQQMMPSIANLEPSLVQQVMSLTPQQIAQLPPDKQQNILALRQQISGNMG